MQPTRLQFAINLKTAKALNLDIPRQLCHFRFYPEKQTVWRPVGTSHSAQFQPRASLPPARAVIYERLATGTCRVSANWGGWRRFQKSRSDT
jgi:hypothetical protein